MISPALVQFVHASGSGDMSALRIPPPTGKASVLSSLEVHFTTGTLSANLVLSRDSRHGSAFDTTMFTLTEAGGGGYDVNYLVDETKFKDWIFGGDQSEPDGIDALVLGWADPTGGSPTKWGYLAGFVKVEDL